MASGSFRWFPVVSCFSSYNYSLFMGAAKVVLAVVTT